MIILRQLFYTLKQLEAVGFQPLTIYYLRLLPGVKPQARVGGESQVRRIFLGKDFVNKEVKWGMERERGSQATPQYIVLHASFR